MEKTPAQVHVMKIDVKAGLQAAMWGRMACVHACGIPCNIVSAFYASSRVNHDSSASFSQGPLQLLTGTFSWPGAGCEVAVLFVRPARVAVLVSLCF